MTHHAIDQDFLRRPGAIRFPEVEITATQAKMWTETRARFLYQCPAYSYLLITMLAVPGSKHLVVFTTAIQTAATDGRHVYINPDFFFPLPADQRVFVLAHEVMHCVWNHMNLNASLRKRGKVVYQDGHELPFNASKMNIAEDYVINDLLFEAKIGALVPNVYHDKAKGSLNETGLEVYRKIYKDPDDGGGGGGGGGQFDDHLEPLPDDQRSEVEWKSAVASAVQVAKLQGKLPACLERAFTDMLEPQVDWTDRIDSLLKRRLGHGSVDWRRPERRSMERGLFMPSKSGNGCGTVVVACDTSGSITAKQINAFLAEVSGILEDVRPERLVLMWCDADVGRVDELEEVGDLNVVRGKGAPGGGGTSFVPVFEKVREMGLEPDALVYLTDGYGSFPSKAPAYPVIWGSIALDAEGYPFGDVVELKDQLARE